MDVPFTPQFMANEIDITFHGGLSLKKCGLFLLDLFFNEFYLKCKILNLS